MDGDRKEIDRKTNDNKQRETSAQSSGSRALDFVNGFLVAHLVVAVAEVETIFSTRTLTLVLLKIFWSCKPDF